MGSLQRFQRHAGWPETPERYLLIGAGRFPRGRAQAATAVFNLKSSEIRVATPVPSKDWTRQTAAVQCPGQCVACSKDAKSLFALEAGSTLHKPLRNPKFQNPLVFDTVPTNNDPTSHVQHGVPVPSFALKKGLPANQAIASGPGQGHLGGPGKPRPTHPPTSENFSSGKNEIYERGAMLEADFRCTNLFFSTSDPPTHRGLGFLPLSHGLPMAGQKRSRAHP